MYIRTHARLVRALNAAPNRTALRYETSENATQRGSPTLHQLPVGDAQRTTLGISYAS